MVFDCLVVRAVVNNVSMTTRILVLLTSLTYLNVLGNKGVKTRYSQFGRVAGSRTTRPKVKECIRSGDQEATLLTSFLIG